MRFGIIGWRGMVGSVLLERMQQEKDYEHFVPEFFSTTQAGARAPLGDGTVGDATDLGALERLDGIVTCQGGEYSATMFPRLRERGWQGYWIDAASTLRMKDSTTIVLDPINGAAIDRALQEGQRDFAGGNCTVSLLLLAVGSLIERGWVEWISSMTYQAASGAGAGSMRELLVQTEFLGRRVGALLDDPASGLLDLERAATKTLRAEDMPKRELGAALATNLLPWIDQPVELGATREEWKSFAEGNKILGRGGPGQPPAIPFDGLCVRVGALRCHSQALTIKLRQDVPLAEIEATLRSSHEWMDFVANDQDSTLRSLTPAAVTGTLRIAVGRLRKLRMGEAYLACFTVGDQLLWGAAEPLRRTLRQVLAFEGRRAGESVGQTREFEPNKLEPQELETSETMATGS